MSENLTKKGEKYKFKGGAKTKVHKAQFIQELKKSTFHIAFSCKQIGIQRRTYNRWRVEDPEFDRACEEMYEEIIDDAEVFLQNKITQKDTTSLIFFLKTKAKNRGYVEKSEIEQTGANIIINERVLTDEQIREMRNESEPKTSGTP